MMSHPQLLLKQELTVPQFCVHMEKSLDKSVDDIQMGTMEDVPSVSSCTYYSSKGERSFESRWGKINGSVNCIETYRS